MALAHCICPSFISAHIGDTGVFTGVFMGKFLQSQDQIILDDDGELMCKYVESIQDDQSKYEVFKVWRMLLENSSNGKLLLTHVNETDSTSHLIYSLITSSATTFRKNIITSDNNSYAEYIGELNRQRVNLLNLQNLDTTVVQMVTKREINYDDFDNDLGWILQRLIRRYSRSHSEDESNDFLRDMLLSKHYEVKDQSREGESSSGQQAGELDLLIESDQSLFSIIEAMRLENVNTNYINTHYKKLLKNYNPLMVKVTFLVSYYEGARFDLWWERYVQHISSIENAHLELDDAYQINSIERIDSPYLGLKKCIHHFYYGSEHFACIHYGVKCK
ncbi:hypothetical protein [Serratia marcescens]|uniref:hypothetical protein n=1 Tax=Serratia marcescens TaxID=615 RepID=UPI001F182D8C|nr:hypothetical protein [Serratia marcescens]UIM55982.1 hypothetical protein LXH15_02295 [Serratia marcescens]HEJ8084090.1 hypothetical protein [Serratia marcescens]